MSTLNGGVLTGDRECLARLAGLLAVAAPSGQGKAVLEAVRFSPGRWVRADVRVAAQLLTIEFRPLGGPETSFTESRRIAVSCSEKKVGRSLGGYLRLVAKRLGERSFAELAALIESHHEPVSSLSAFSDAQAGWLGAGAGRRRDKWWDFFADQDFRNEEYELVWTGRALTIMLGERECYYSRPDSDFRRWSFLNYPHMGLPNAGSRGLEDARRHHHRDVMPFELKEKDIVLGTARKEEEILEALRGKTGQVDLLVTSGSCTTAIMGMDALAWARRCGRQLGCPVVARRQNYREDLPESVAQIFVSFLEGAPSPCCPDSGAVNLYDFPPRCIDEEFSPMLAEMGLRTNLGLIPEVSVEAVRRIPEALWQVCPETSARARGLPPVFASRGLELVGVCAPYGLRDTRRCLETIARRTKTLPAFRAAWDRRWGSLEGSWEELRQQARRYRLALVVSDEGLLQDPATFGGIPVLAMLREMGFGIDILVYSPGTRARVLGGFSSSAKERRLPFATAGELERLLREGDFRAVFSDIFYDWRLTSAGKAQFSRRHFEMGLDGALRSLRSLLAVCRLPFYENYSSFLPQRCGRVHG